MSIGLSKLHAVSVRGHIQEGEGITDLRLSHHLGGVQQNRVDSRRDRGQLVVVEDTEERVIGQQAHSDLPQQPLALRVTVVEVVGDPPARKQGRLVVDSFGG